MSLITPVDGERLILPGHAGARQVVLSEEEAMVVRRTVAGAGARYRVILTPKVLALSGQEATVFVCESPGNLPDAWTGVRLAVAPRVVASGESVVIDRLRIERRGEDLVGPQVVEAVGVPMDDGQTLLIAPEASPTGAGDDLIVLMRVRVLPAS
jgi:hypothetical protein